MEWTEKPLTSLPQDYDSNCNTHGNIKRDVVGGAVKWSKEKG